MQLDIVTPERRLASVANTDVVLPCEASAVSIPGEEGYFQVLPGHAPFITLLGTGVLTFEAKGKAPVQLMVSGGYCEVDRDKVTIMTSVAALPEDVSLEDEKGRHASLAKELAQLGPVALDDENFQRVRAEVERAATKMKLLR